MRRFPFVFGSLTVALGASVACSFPDVTFGSAEDLEAGLEAGAEADADPQPVRDGGQDALEEQDSGPILIDGSTIDDLVVVDAGGKVDAAGCVGCDCDGDKYNDLTKPGCENAGGAHDCDDNDSRVHPNQGYLFDSGGEPAQRRLGLQRHGREALGEGGRDLLRPHAGPRLQGHLRLHRARRLRREGQLASVQEALGRARARLASPTNRSWRRSSASERAIEAAG